MSAVSVSELKAQLNLDDYRDEGLLQLKIDAAEAYVSSFIGSPILVAMPVVPDEDGTLSPPPLCPGSGDNQTSRVDACSLLV